METYLDFAEPLAFAVVPGADMGPGDRPHRRGPHQAYYLLCAQPPCPLSILGSEARRRTQGCDIDDPHLFSDVVAAMKGAWVRRVIRCTGHAAGRPSSLAFVVVEIRNELDLVNNHEKCVT